MNKVKEKSGIYWIWLSILVLGIDLFTKYLVVKSFALYESISILPIFNLTYVRNTGAAFSFLADHSGWQKYFFICLALIVSGVLTFLLTKNNYSQKLSNCAYALIIGGGLANGVDRLYNGYVVDFLDFYWDIYHYPVFNIADIGIVVGASLLLLESFLDSKKKKRVIK
ncbi:MAG: signal peptidase II [Pasteurellales bacterium]|nr:MAG: signal peptidase II [Pasteurellales bacterium]